MNTNDIYFEEKTAQCGGMVGIVTLNRPHALNALTLDMCQRFSEQLFKWKRNDAIKAVIVEGVGDRAFCAGGDIRALYEHRANPNVMREFFWHEYRLNTLIHHFPKPYFAFLHRITMGGGAGVSIHGAYRIANENLRFAMPETKIGFYPDIGAGYFLNRCPGYSGLYLGLTGTTIDATDAFALGLITHIIPDKQFKALKSALFEAKTITEDILKPFCVSLNHAPIIKHQAIIDDCFSQHSIKAILNRLDKTNPWTRHVAQQLQARCPSSLKITLESYHRAKKMDFDDIIQMNFNITQQFLNSPDFFEGIRAVIIDKDQTPKWQPPISDEEMTKYFEYKGKKLF